MANDQDVVIASQQHHDPHQPKALDADGYETGKGLGDDEIPGATCQRFSIRGYVATIRKVNINTCWPFPQHLLETRIKEAGNLALPLLEIPSYRWWNCENCLGDISASAENPIEKENVRDSPASMLVYHDNFDRGCMMFLTTNVDMQDKQKKNMLDRTEIVESLTVEKSVDAAGSTAYELTDKEKINDDGVVTDGVMDIGRNQYTVSMELENDKSGITESEKKSSGISHCLSNSRSSKGIISMTETCHHDQDREVVCAEMGQPVMETLMSSILASKRKEELSSKQNKREELQIICQASNSWEYFSRTKNGFKEISEKMKGKETWQATSRVIGSENSLDAKKLKNMSAVPVSDTYAENVETGQQVVVKGKDEKTMSKVIESLTLQTMVFSIQNTDDSRRDSDGRNDTLCLNGNGSSSPKQVRECTDLSTSQTSLEKENMLLLEQSGKLKVGESRNKRRPQKKRSIADIIASKPSRLESWNKEKEESMSEIMEENISRTENNEQSPRPEEDHMEAPIDAVKMSSKPTIETAGVSEVSIDAEMVNAILKKRRPEKLTGRKKQARMGIHSLDACSTILATNSSISSLSEAATNALEIPQGTSPLVSATRDNAPEDSFLNPEYVQSGQKFSEMEDEIPMDIVELMAKNQHERGLSSLKRLHESHTTQKDKKRLKTKETDHSHINKCVEGGAGLKQDTATRKSKAQLKQTGKANPQTSLRNRCQSDLLVDYGQIDVCQGARDISFISNKEGIISSSCKSDLPMLQSTQWYNPWGKHSPDFVPPILDEAIAAYNLPFPVAGTKSHVAINHSNPYGSNGMVLDSMQLQGPSSYCGYMQMQNLCREGTSALSDFTGSMLPNFQNKSVSSLNDNGSLHQNLTNTEGPRNLTSERSDLGNSGNTFYVLSESLNGNGIPNLPVSTDGTSGPFYFNRQSNSALLQQVNAQARQPFGNKYCFPTSPMLRLTGQSVSVPAKCGNDESMATENGDNRNFSTLSQVSSQMHASWFHLATSTSSGVVERNQSETFSGTERVFTGSEPIQGGMRMNEQITGSIRPIPPVPKFTSSGQYVSTGLSGISAPSFAVPDKGNVALESSILRPKSPFRDTLTSGRKQKKGLQITSGHNDNLQTFSTAPPDSQSTKVVKGSSSTKGLRTYRPTPRDMHLNKYHNSALDIYIENRHHCLQSPWVLGSSPKQNLTKEAEKSEALNLDKGNEKSVSCRKKAGNVEICTLNRNPAEINLDDEEDGCSFGNEHFVSAHSTLAHGERERNVAISQGQKRRRTLKKKHLQEFLSQKHGYVGDLAKTNMDNLESLEGEVTSVEELVGNIV